MGTTFLFTDIEGSTRLLDTFGDGYADLLAAHHRCVRDAARDAAGEEIGTSGDAFYLAFPDARSALDAAIRAQHLLASYPWPSGGEVKVRMGLHAGVGRHTEAGWVGLGLHEVARLCDAAHGGQILLSESAAGELRSVELPDGVEFVDLGVHQLKDLVRQRLFQVVAEGLDRSFPPPRAVRDRGHNLPASVTSFVGRTKEKEELTSLVPERRLVTLVGPGGVGKTRLALEVAAELLDTHPDGAWLVDLAAIREEALIPDAIVRALQLRPNPGSDPMDTATAWVADREVIVILDNCEHLLEGSAVAAHRLVSAGDRVRLIATSQAPLDVAGETRYPVTSLAVATDERGEELPAASHLFLERAGLIEPGLPVHREAIEAIERICTALDGLPLAIEMAAGWVDYLDLQAIADRLGQRFELLAKGSRSATERHRSLLAMVTWSYELLEPREQANLRRLAVMPGEFDLATAQALAPEGQSFEDSLRQLVERSLVQTVNRGDRRRFRLAETIRAFGSVVVGDATERAETIGRLLEHFTQRASAVSRPVVGVAEAKELQRLQQDLPNIRVALEWALANEPAAGLALAVNLRTFWERRGLASEGRQWVETLLSESPDAAEKLIIEGQEVIGLLANILGETSVAREWHRRGAAAAEQAGLEELRLRGLQGEADTYMREGDDAEARRLLTRVLDEALAVEAVDRIARISISLGIVTARLGDLAIARRHFEKAIEIKVKQGDLWGLAIATGDLGWLLGELGETEAGASHLRTAIRFWLELDDSSDALMTTLEDLGRILVRSGSARPGALLIGFAHRIRLDLGTPSLDAPALQKTMAEVREALGPSNWAELESEVATLRHEDAVALALDETRDLDPRAEPVEGIAGDEP